MQQQCLKDPNKDIGMDFGLNFGLDLELWVLIEDEKEAKENISWCQKNATKVP